MSKALVIIDVQNDYFPGGSYPLWEADAVMDRIEAAAQKARAEGHHVVLVQHVADPSMGPAPFFNKGSEGADIHARLAAVAPEAPVVVKAFADSFVSTELEAVLSTLGVTELLVCGMMTQNCVTHTAISKSAEKYTVKVLGDLCTTVDQMLHMIALHAMSTRVEITTAEAAL